ncbi:MAG: hypothetical protein J3K34DRAFT_409848 [Monoraphidium minutum]|nr:MAG: hypothetical protein J3K34DRAFT_409848 [Monoraphidium minutum]
MVPVRGHQVDVTPFIIAFNRSYFLQIVPVTRPFWGLRSQLSCDSAARKHCVWTSATRLLPCAWPGAPRQRSWRQRAPRRRVRCAPVAANAPQPQLHATQAESTSACGENRARTGRAPAHGLCSRARADTGPAGAARPCRSRPRPRHAAAPQQQRAAGRRLWPRHRAGGRAAHLLPVCQQDRQQQADAGQQPHPRRLHQRAVQ